MHKISLAPVLSATRSRDSCCITAHSSELIGTTTPYRPVVAAGRAANRPCCCVAGGLTWPSPGSPPAATVWWPTTGGSPSARHGRLRRLCCARRAPCACWSGGSSCRRAGAAPGLRQPRQPSCPSCRPPPDPPGSCGIRAGPRPQPGRSVRSSHWSQFLRSCHTLVARPIATLNSATLNSATLNSATRNSSCCHVATPSLGRYDAKLALAHDRVDAGDVPADVPGGAVAGGAVPGGAVEGGAVEGGAVEGGSGPSDEGVACPKELRPV